MSAHHKSNVQPEPIVDEWGFYDPQRAGLTAVLERLEAQAAAAAPSRIAAWGTKKEELSAPHSVKDLLPL